MKLICTQSNLYLLASLSLCVICTLSAGCKDTNESQTHNNLTKEEPAPVILPTPSVPPSTVALENPSSHEEKTWKEIVQDLTKVNFDTDYKVFAQSVIKNLSELDIKPFMSRLKDDKSLADLFIFSPTHGGEGDGDEAYKIVLQYLLDQGFDINLKDSNGETLLFHLVSPEGINTGRPRWSLIKFCLDKGSDRSVTDIQGRPLLRWAEKWYQEDALYKDPETLDRLRALLKPN